MDFIYEQLKNEAISYIEKHLKESRLQHTYAVAKEAVNLAKAHGADVEKAEVAGLFHDMAKNMTVDEMNEHVRLFELGDRYIDRPNLAHSKIATELLKRDFAVDDEDILNAVASHTTGRAGMSDLEKIVFLADAIEPARKYPSVDLIRKQAYVDLNEACKTSLNRTIAFIEGKNDYLDTDTLDAYNYFLNIDKEQKAE